MKTRFSIIPIAFLLVVFNLQAISQNNFKASMGVGLLESINIGVGYQFKQSEAGISIGKWPTQLNGLNLTGNYYYHFAGKSRFSDVHPWFVRAGINLIIARYTYSIEYYYRTILSLGREFNFSDKIGIGIDLGASYYFYHHVKKLGENPFPTGNVFYFFPNGSFKIFYRF